MPAPSSSTCQPYCGELLRIFSIFPKNLQYLRSSKRQFDIAVGEMLRCGYLREYRNLAKPYHPTYIQLVDPFILFHYHFIEPLGGDAPRSWADFVANQGRYTNWRGNAFEVVCLHHVGQIKAALGIAGVDSREYPWASERVVGGAQIDLVIERADRVTNLCEMKYTDEPYRLSREREQELARKRELFREETGTRHALKTVLVSASGTVGSDGGSIARKLSADDLFA